MIPPEDFDVRFECLCALVNISRYTPNYDWHALAHRWLERCREKYIKSKVDEKWYGAANRNYNYNVNTIYHYAKHFNPGWSPRDASKSVVLVRASDVVTEGLAV